MVSMINIVRHWHSFTVLESTMNINVRKHFSLSENKWYFSPSHAHSNIDKEKKSPGWNNNDKKSLSMKVIFLKLITHKPVAIMQLCPPRFPETDISGTEWAVWGLARIRKHCLKTEGGRATKQEATKWTFKSQEKVSLRKPKTMSLFPEEVGNCIRYEDVLTRTRKE